jgi:hypothetical protein
MILLESFVVLHNKLGESIGTAELRGSQEYIRWKIVEYCIIATTALRHLLS